MKTCTECNRNNIFSKYLCKKCYQRKYYLENKAELKVKERKYRFKNKEKIKIRVHKYRLKNLKACKAGVRKHHLKIKFNLTEKLYSQMLKDQNGVCKICKQPETTVDKKSDKIRQLAVDHCHITNRVRGLLCYKCNTGIGMLNDNPQLLKVALEYLNPQLILFEDWLN